MGTSKLLFTVDLEDWFHILGEDYELPQTQWPTMESRIDKNTDKLLEIFQKNNIKATFFSLGWVAEKYPNLIKKIDLFGHEIASHGYGHQLVYNLTKDAFREDIVKSKYLIEDITGKKVLGYRAPGFSIIQKNLWALDILLEQGYLYDSSFFPMHHSHGGIKLNNSLPHFIRTPDNNEIFEIPISKASFWGYPLVYTGGGYLRLCPKYLMKYLLRKQYDNDETVIFYIHPREIDYYQPRLKIKPVKSFKYYYGIRSVEKKLAYVFKNYQISTIKELL